MNFNHLLITIADEQLASDNVNDKSKQIRDILKKYEELNRKYDLAIMKIRSRQIK
jgi:hypothetical protein